jgi:rubrerythrin
MLRPLFSSYWRRSDSQDAIAGMIATTWTSIGTRGPTSIAAIATATHTATTIRDEPIAPAYRNNRDRQFDFAWAAGLPSRRNHPIGSEIFIRKESAVNLKGSKTEKNLKDAFAGESQANRRYLYFAAKADVEGFNDVSAVFRSTAEGETGHAHGHLEYLEAVGDPATGLPIGPTASNLKAAIAGETHEYTDMYPGMAKAAREEGFGEIADWFETLAKAERSHANRFQKALDNL